MTKTELADAMIKGLNTPGVRESRLSYVAVLSLLSIEDKPCMACALGCALIGLHDGDFEKAETVFDQAREWVDRTEEDETDIFAKLLDIPALLAFEIERKHMNNIPIKEIATWLKSSEREVTT